MSEIEPSVAPADPGEPIPADAPALDPEEGAASAELAAEPAQGPHPSRLEESPRDANSEQVALPKVGAPEEPAIGDEPAQATGSPDASQVARPEQRLGQWLHEAPGLASDLYGLLTHDELAEDVRRAAAASLTGLSYLLAMTPASVQSLAELEWVLCATLLVASQELPLDAARWQALSERVEHLEELASTCLGVSTSQLREHAQSYYRIDVRGRSADDLLAVAAARLELAEELGRHAESPRPPWTEDTYQLRTLAAYLQGRLTPPT